MRVTGYQCKTNLPSNTAFRGFGTPQGVMFAEDIRHRVAAYLGLDPAVVCGLGFPLYSLFSLPLILLRHLFLSSIFFFFSVIAFPYHQYALTFSDLLHFNLTDG